MRVSLMRVFEILGIRFPNIWMFARTVWSAVSSNAITGALGLIPEATNCPA